MAKYFDIRVDEFGLGYPPRARKLFRWRGTDFTLNWLPFGGFVKIYGENPAESLMAETELPLTKSSDFSSKNGQTLLKAIQFPQDNFQSKNKGIQASVLVAGVFFNFLFAWLLLSLALMTGLPAPQGISLPLQNEKTMITAVVPGSPAELAGLKSGDVIYSIDGLPVSPEEASEKIRNSNGPLRFVIDRGGDLLEKSVTPSDSVLVGQKAVGIAMDVVGTARVSFFSAIYHGLRLTWALTLATASALGTFVIEGITGKGDLSQVTGPVGLVGITGEVAGLGWGYLLSFVALISINLSIINLVPFPALDGGRLLFVAIETLIRKRVPAKIFNISNTVGFALLIFLMILITIRDVRNIF